MKKITRVVWIGALSGLAFLTACCSQNGLSRKERKQLVKEREQLQEELLQYQRCSDTDDYEAFMSCNGQFYALENRLDTINFRLGDTIDLDRNYRRRQILQRIDSLNFLIANYTPPCIYGGPDLNDGSWKVDTGLDNLYQELEKAEDELDAFDGIDEKETPYEALYGSPDLRIKPVRPEVVYPENENE